MRKQKTVDCPGCVYDYYEPDTNWCMCKHPDFDDDNPNHCPGRYDKADAKADTKYGHCDKY